MDVIAIDARTVRTTLSSATRLATRLGTRVRTRAATISVGVLLGFGGAPGCQGDDGGVPNNNFAGTDSANDSGLEAGTGNEVTGDGDGDPSQTTGDGDPTTGDPTTGDPTTGDGDPTTGDGDPTTGDGDPTTGDGDGALCAGGCGADDCGSCPEGPTAIVVDTFSIDSTEITFAQYAQFLAVDFDPMFLPELLAEGCESKADFTPDNWPLNPPATIPVVGVDWCDASAYCAWAGKHLCGAIGGGSAALVDVQNPASNEWYRACTGGGVTNYPYGLAYDPEACNTIDAPYGQLTDVGGLPTCQGGVDGLFDMSGNVWEWTNSCTIDGECRRRGGSMYSDGLTSRCGIDSTRPRELRTDTQGFRCCSDI